MSRFPDPLANLARMMPPVDPMKLTPLLGRQRSEERVVDDFRPRSKPALAIVQVRSHSLQFRHNRLLHLSRWHAAWNRPFRRLPPSWQVSEIHHQQSGHTMLQRRARAERSTLF